MICVYLARAILLSNNDEGAAADLLIDQLLRESPLVSPCLPTEQTTPDVELPPPMFSRRLETSDGKVNSPRRRRLSLQVVIVLEGIHDVEFLKRISRIVAAANSSVPDLIAWESAGRIAFVVNNGNWMPFPASSPHYPPKEFHLLDREVPPVTAQREGTSEALNSRGNTRAFLTQKRAIENYLHPDAIREVSDLEVAFSDFDDVPGLVARAAFRQAHSQSWTSLSRRARCRLRDNAKRWLNRQAVERMTSERLAERDPEGEVIGWLHTIAELSATRECPLI